MASDRLLNSLYNTWLQVSGDALIGAYDQQNYKLNFRFNADMSNTFNGCKSLEFNLNKYRNMFENVTNMSSTFRECGNISGNIIIPSNVVNMAYAYGYTAGFRSKTLSGIVNLPDSVTNIAGAFYASDISRVDRIGNGVTNMANAFLNCRQLRGTAKSGPNVIDMFNAYQNVTGITEPACGDHVANMAHCYYQCSALTGPAVCGPNVKDMARAYYSCTHLRGDAVCGDRVDNMLSTYMYCYELDGKPVCGPNVEMMPYTYYECQNITGDPVCGPKVKNMYDTYYNCYRLTGPPVCGDAVIYFFSTYQNCYNITGDPVCGPNVENMFQTYYSCYNLTGQPVCGPKVTNMVNAYYECCNITGQPVCGPNVTNMQRAYYNCRNLTGRADLGNSRYHYDAYEGCSNLSVAVTSNSPNDDGNYVYVYANCPNITDAYFNTYCGTLQPRTADCFRGHHNKQIDPSYVSSLPAAYDVRLNIYVNAGSLMNDGIYNGNTGKIFGSSLFSATGFWTLDPDNTCYYNAMYNVYVYYNA